MSQSEFSPAAKRCLLQCGKMDRLNAMMETSSVSNFNASRLNLRWNCTFEPLPKPSKGSVINEEIANFFHSSLTRPLSISKGKLRLRICPADKTGVYSPKAFSFCCWRPSLRPVQWSSIIWLHFLPSTSWSAKLYLIPWWKSKLAAYGANSFCFTGQTLKGGSCHTKISQTWARPKCKGLPNV